MDGKTDRKTRVDQRRRLLFRRVVLDNNPMSLNQFRKLLGEENYSDEAVARDLEAFNDVGCQIQLLDSTTTSGDKDFVFLEGPHTDNDSIRQNINIEAKKLAASLAASLISGAAVPPPIQIPRNSMPNTDVNEALKQMLLRSEAGPTASVLRSLLEELDQKLGAQQGQWGIKSAEQILDLLRHTSHGLGKKFESLSSRLFSFWSETSRIVAIDSGTTNIILARFLRELDIPLPGSRLCSLTICTNSRRIFEVLGPSPVWVKTIIIGGQQKFHSSTIAGAMAELFLRSVSMLQFGMCIIGSTRIDLDRFTICSDSQEESAIKNLLMDRSSFRVICVDNSKFQLGPGREGYRFASIDPMHIDLILTNSPLKGKKKTKADEQQYADFLANVAAIEARGVPVLIARSAATF